jgi:hypothetical protein
MPLNIELEAMKMRYKVELEKLLTADLQRKEPGPLTRVVISDVGNFAVLHVAEKQTLRKLSHYAKDSLRTGEEVFLATGESFYEPEG